MVEQLRGFSITAIGIEASGGYGRGAACLLQAAGMSVRQVNPFKLRQSAKASRGLAKNDPPDAGMIASFVGFMPTRPPQRTTPAASSSRSSLFAANSALRKSPLRMPPELLEGPMSPRLSPYCRARRRDRAAKLPRDRYSVFKARQRLRMVIGLTGFSCRPKLDVNATLVSKLPFVRSGAGRARQGGT
jgi:Transposase